MNYNQDDINSMALCIWKEARGDGQEGMQAVANVISNRAREWYQADNSPLHITVYAKNQFTSMSVPTDSEFNLVPHSGDPQYAYALSICEPIINQQMEDITKGSLYYAYLKEATSGWFSRNISGVDGQGTPDHPLLAVIGHQNFYK
jgi:spore germination cell wall hydrolase CwlJ-like protein